jgi:hypothetical protein
MKIKLFNILTISLALCAIFLSSSTLISNKTNAQFSTAASLHLSLGGILIALFQIHQFKRQLFYPVLIMSLLALLMLISYLINN